MKLKIAGACFKQRMGQLEDQILDEPASELFDGLRAAFWDEVKNLYPEAEVLGDMDPEVKFVTVSIRI